MDFLAEVLKAILTVGVIGLVLILIPIVVMFIFGIATGIDEEMNR